MFELDLGDDGQLLKSFPSDMKLGSFTKASQITMLKKKWGDERELHEPRSCLRVQVRDAAFLSF